MGSPGGRGLAVYDCPDKGCITGVILAVVLAIIEFALAVVGAVHLLGGQ